MHGFVIVGLFSVLCIGGCKVQKLPPPHYLQENHFVLSEHTEAGLEAMSYCKNEDQLVEKVGHTKSHSLLPLRKLPCGHWMVGRFNCGLCVVPPRESTVYLVGENPRYFHFEGKTYFYPQGIKGYPTCYYEHFVRAYEERKQYFILQHEHY